MNGKKDMACRGRKTFRLQMSKLPDVAGSARPPEFHKQVRKKSSYLLDNLKKKQRIVLFWR